MNTSEQTLKLIASLNQHLSKAQLKKDLKALNNSLSVRILARLTAALTRRQLQKDLEQLGSLQMQV